MPLTLSRLIPSDPDSRKGQALRDLANTMRCPPSTWVRGHAQDYILEHFRQISDRRKQAHAAHIDRITHHAYQYYHAGPHPTDLAAAQAALKRGIDEDWQASVQKYPEVLEYFYSLGPSSPVYSSHRSP